MSEILIINGPNINILGKRENDIYGNVTYESLVAKINDFSSKKNLKARFFQSNAEHEIVNKTLYLINSYKLRHFAGLFY